MAKAQFKVGADIDFLTEEELGRRLDKMADTFQSLMLSQEGETFTRAQTFLTDSTGGTASFDQGAAQIYRVPTGYNAYLLRAAIDYEGSNVTSPTSCDVRIVADANTPSSLRALNNSVPAVFSASRNHAPIFRGGQRIGIAMTGGPHSTQIYVAIQILLTGLVPVKSDTLLGIVQPPPDDPYDRP